MDKKRKIIDYLITAFLLILLGTLVYDYLLGKGDKSFRIILILSVIGVLYFLYKKVFLHKYSSIFTTVLLFVFFSMYVGNILNIYKIISFYDKLLHFFSGIIIGHIGFSIVRNVIDVKNNKLFLFIFIISFSAGCAAVWELYEFTTDSLFGFNSQNNSLNDTMYDIIYGILGSILWWMFMDIRKMYFIKNKNINNRQ